MGNWFGAIFIAINKSKHRAIAQSLQIKLIRSMYQKLDM